MLFFQLKMVQVRNNYKNKAKTEYNYHTGNPVIPAGPGVPCTLSTSRAIMEVSLQLQEESYRFFFNSLKTKKKKNKKRLIIQQPQSGRIRIKKLRLVLNAGRDN